MSWHLSAGGSNIIKLSVPPLLSEFVVMGMYIGLPMVWTSLVSWAGMQMMGGFGGFTDQATASSRTAGQRGGQMADKAARKSGKIASKAATEK